MFTIQPQGQKLKNRVDKKETFSLNLNSQICIKISPDDLNLLKKACEIKRLGLNSFIRSSAVAEALQTIKEDTTQI